MPASPADSPAASPADSPAASPADAPADSLADAPADSLTGIRSQIDALDAQVVRHLAARERLVRRAAAFKTDDHSVRAPARVEKVIARVRALSTEAGASPDVAEQVYRAMINAFISLELAEHHATTQPTNPPTPRP